MEAGQSPPLPPSAPPAPAAPPSTPLQAIFRAKLKADVPVPIAGVQTLLHVMSNSRAVTIMGIHPNTPLVLSFAILLHLTQWVPLVSIGLPLAWASHLSLGDLEKETEKIEPEIA